MRPSMAWRSFLSMRQARWFYNVHLTAKRLPKLTPKACAGPLGSVELTRQRLHRFAILSDSTVGSRQISSWHGIPRKKSKTRSITLSKEAGPSKRRGRAHTAMACYTVSCGQERDVGFPSSPHHEVQRIMPTISVARLTAVRMATVLSKEQNNDYI